MESCDFYKRQISLFFDFENLECTKEDLELHLMHCKECQNFKSEIQDIKNNITKLQYEAPKELSERWRNAVSVQSKKRNRFKKLSNILSIASVAAVFVFLFSVIFNFIDTKNSKQITLGNNFANSEITQIQQNKVKSIELDLSDDNCEIPIDTVFVKFYSTHEKLEDVISDTVLSFGMDYKIGDTEFIEIEKDGLDNIIDVFKGQNIDLKIIKPQQNTFLIEISL